MSSNSTQTTLVPPEADFAAILRSLSTSVEHVMISWYDVQLRTSSHLRTSLVPLKNFLQTHGEDLLAYLQKCHDFSEEALILQKNLKEEPDSGTFSWLDELASSSDEISRDSQTLVRKSDGGMKHLSSLKSQFSNLNVLGLSKRSSARTSAKFGNSNSEKLSSTASERVAFSRASPPLDGLAAIASANTALVDLRNNLQLLQQFWDLASRTCRALIKSTTQGYTEPLADIWKIYQEEILCATVSITKSLDAIAVGPDTHRRQQRRRGSSKSDISIPPQLPEWAVWTMKRFLKDAGDSMGGS
ncbi:hypothetical protein C8R43DRAFT_974472 [Mycena crocata]|nr:hypothetical protein C8R43DRAFT_974472 [Mycena crocata]